MVHPVRHVIRFIDHVTTFQRDYCVLYYTRPQPNMFRSDWTIRPVDADTAHGIVL
jgi:hypothetical protein